MGPFIAYRLLTYWTIKNRSSGSWAEAKKGDVLYLQPLEVPEDCDAEEDSWMRSVGDGTLLDHKGGRHSSGPDSLSLDSRIQRPRTCRSLAAAFSSAAFACSVPFGMAAQKMAEKIHPPTIIHA